MKDPLEESIVTALVYVYGEVINLADFLLVLNLKKEGWFWFYERSSY